MREKIGKDVIRERWRRWAEVGERGDFNYTLPSQIDRFREELKKEQEKRLKGYTYELEEIAKELSQRAEEVKERAKRKRGILERVIKGSGETEREESGRVEKGEGTEETERVEESED